MISGIHLFSERANDSMLTKCFQGINLKKTLHSLYENMSGGFLRKCGESDTIYVQ
jgi:hypothetical protein